MGDGRDFERLVARIQIVTHDLSPGAPASTFNDCRKLERELIARASWRTRAMRRQRTDESLRRLAQEVRDVGGREVSAVLGWAWHRHAPTVTNDYDDHHIFC
jgi:hypothetical protein